MVLEEHRLVNPTLSGSGSVYGSMSGAVVSESREWGSFIVLHDSGNYKVKRLVIHPGKSTSLQRHNHRQEHWVCVGGSGTVLIGSAMFPIWRGMSVDVNLREWHKLSADEHDCLVIVETQIGDYCGEDDIERIE